MALESVAPDDWRPAVIVSPYEGEGERTDCKNYGGISSLSVIRTCFA